MKTNDSIRRLTESAMIASLYVILTLCSKLFSLDSGAIQLRLSEGLSLLPIFISGAIPGLFVGCFLSNLFLGCALPDILFGSFATLLGAILTRAIRKAPKWFLPIPNLLVNTLVMGPVIAYCYLGGLNGANLSFALLSVGIGEFLSAYLLALILYTALLPHKERIFR